MKKGLFHAPAVTWSKFNPMSSLQRWLCRVRVEKLTVEKIGRLFFLMRCRQEGQRLKWSEVGCFLFRRGIQKMGLHPKVIVIWAESWKQRLRGGP